MAFCRPGFRCTRVCSEALILAFGIEGLRQWIASSSFVIAMPVRMRLALASVLPLALAAALVIPNVPATVEPTSPTSESEFFKVAAGRIPTNSVVLSYPFPEPPIVSIGTGIYGAHPVSSTVNDVLLDQALTGNVVQLVGGYGWRPTSGKYDSALPSPLSPSSVEALFNSAFLGVASTAQSKSMSRSDVTKDLRLFLRRYDIGTVLVLPVGHNPGAVVSHLSEAIGPPTRVAGAAVWFDVQKRL